MESRMGRRMSKEVLELKDEIKSIKDCKTIDDFDMEKLDLQRGETPENIKDRCLQLCKDYLSGNWLQQSLDTIDFRRVSGGLTNQLYYIGISEPSNQSEAVAQEVAIRIYGPKYFNNLDNDGNERLTDVIIALLVSQNQLGPKIYGLFEDGQIQHWYKHRQFRLNEQKELGLQLFQKLARVHAMDVPIKKSTNWVFEFFDDFYATAFKNFPINDLIKEQNCSTLLRHDLKAEIDWLKDMISKSESPLVFSHVDFRGSNIMVTESNEIVLCDFEYSSYGYRGFDFGTIIVEWNRNLNELFSKSEKQVQKFPDDSQIRTLIKAYIEETEKIVGKTYSENKINSIDQILYETKLFSLAAHMFIIMFCIKNDETSENEFPMDKKVMIQFAEQCYEGYWFLKDKFTEQKLFK